MVTLGAAISHLYPAAVAGFDFLVQDGELTRWKAGLGPQPTAEQIVQASTDIEATESARQQILGSFRSLPRGVQAFFEPVRAEVDAAISARDWPGVRDIIATAPTPTSELNTIRLEFVSLVNRLLPQ